MTPAKRRARRRKLAVSAVVLFLLGWALTAYVGWQTVYGWFHFGMPPAQEPWSVTVLDVGQGESVLVKDGEVSLLIDTGELPCVPRVRAAMDALEIDRPDILAVSHLHSDHMGGAEALLQSPGAGKVWLSPMATAPDGQSQRLLETLKHTGQPVEYPKPGEIFPLGEHVTVEVLGPIREDKNINNQSLVFCIHTPEGRVLFCGDMEEEAEYALLDRGTPLEAEVLLVGHHGSDTSTTPEFLEAVSPDYAVLSVGEGNRHGLPDMEVVSRLKESGAQVLRTDLDGDIRFTAGTDGFAITTEK